MQSLSKSIQHGIDGHIDARSSQLRRISKSMVAITFLLTATVTHSQSVISFLKVYGNNLFGIGAGEFASYMYDYDVCKTRWENVSRTLISTGIAPGVVGAIIAKATRRSAIAGFTVGSTVGILADPYTRKLLADNLPSDLLRDMELCQLGQHARALVKPVFVNFKAIASTCRLGDFEEITTRDIENCYHGRAPIRAELQTLLVNIYSINNAACIAAKSVWVNYSRMSARTLMEKRQGSFVGNAPFDCDGQPLEIKFPYAFP